MRAVKTFYNVILEGYPHFLSIAGKILGGVGVETFLKTGKIISLFWNDNVGYPHFLSIAGKILGGVGVETFLKTGKIISLFWNDNV